jgi:hypothetical protein
MGDLLSLKVAYAKFALKEGAKNVLFTKRGPQRLREGVCGSACVDGENCAYPAKAAMHAAKNQR